MDSLANSKELMDSGRSLPMGVPQRSLQFSQRAPDLPSHARIVGVCREQGPRGPRFLEWKNHRERGPVPFHELALADERLARSEEHTSELQSRRDLVCRL